MGRPRDAEILVMVRGMSHITRYGTIGLHHLLEGSDTGSAAEAMDQVEKELKRFFRLYTRIENRRDHREKYNRPTKTKREKIRKQDQAAKGP